MRLSSLKQSLDIAKQSLIVANAKIISPATSLQPPSTLSIGNASTLSVGATTPGTLQLYTSPSGHNFVQASTNDDSMLMDLSHDFFVPPIVPPIDDPILTDADAEALAAAQQAAAAEEANRAEQVVQQLEAATRRLKLKPPRSVSGYKHFWENVTKTLPKSVPVLYNLILGNSSLCDIVGYDDEDGWKKGSSSFNSLNSLCRPSEASQLVADCFQHVFHTHHMHLQKALDSGVPLESLHSLSRVVEDGMLHLSLFFLPDFSNVI